jgi:hypothetical protein
MNHNSRQSRKEDRRIDIDSCVFDCEKFAEEIYFIHDAIDYSLFYIIFNIIFNFSNCIFSKTLIF